MKKILLISLFFISCFQLTHAQVAIFKALPFMDTISQPGLRKFGLKLSFNGINVPVIFKTVSTSSTPVVYYGDSVSNLVNGSMPITTLEHSFFQCYAINALNSNDVYGPITVFPVNENVMSIAVATEPTGTNCDGYIELYLDQGPGPNYDVSTTYDPSLFWNWTSNFGGWTASMTNGIASGLCSRKYKIAAPYQCFYSHDGYNYGMDIEEDFLVLLGQYAFPSSTGLDVIVNPYQQAATPLCNGKANVTIVNSSAAFQYSYDGGSYTSSDSIINLCEGLHTVKVKNATDSIGKYFIISNINNVYNNSNPFGSVIDTIVYNFTNCNFNYNLPVDSASLVSYNQIDTNTVFLSWQVWQSGVSTSISDTISYLYQSGTSMVSLMIFCGNARTTSAQNFKTFRVNDYVFLNQTVGLKENKKDRENIEIYPNPFSNSISLKSDNISLIKNMEVFDILGEKIPCSFQSIALEMTIMTEHLKSGFYTISITNNLGQKSSFKIIKQ